MKSKVQYPHSISRTCLAQEFGLVDTLCGLDFFVFIPLNTLFVSYALLIFLKMVMVVLEVTVVMVTV